MRRRRITVVEDEEHILEVIAYNLKRESYDVSQARDGEAGLALVRRERPDLVVLDIMLPGIDGIEVCRRLKADAALRDTPVIMVTAKAEESDVVLGLGVGADDYITKPFSPRELIARVKAALRRQPWRDERDCAALIEIHGIRINRERHEISSDGVELALTPSEFELMYKLASQPGRVFGRDELLNLLDSGGPYVLERNIDTHIKSLRKKLGAKRELVETIRGIGYRLKEVKAP